MDSKRSGSKSKKSTNSNSHRTRCSHREQDSQRQRPFSALSFSSQLERFRDGEASDFVFPNTEKRSTKKKTGECSTHRRKLPTIDALSSSESDELSVVNMRDIAKRLEKVRKLENRVLRKRYGLPVVESEESEESEEIEESEESEDDSEHRKEFLECFKRQEEKLEEISRKLDGFNKDLEEFRKGIRDFNLSFPSDSSAGTGTTSERTRSTPDTLQKQESSSAQEPEVPEGILKSMLRYDLAKLKNVIRDMAEEGDKYAKEMRRCREVITFYEAALNEGTVKELLLPKGSESDNPGNIYKVLHRLKKAPTSDEPPVLESTSTLSPRTIRLSRLHAAMESSGRRYSDAALLQMASSHDPHRPTPMAARIASEVVAGMPLDSSVDGVIELVRAVPPAMFTSEEFKTFLKSYVENRSK